ncbi:MAG: FAD-binding oxidoreductase [Gammaproteobacteria bacterium]|nr:FAD-binding oxidoreductase [Gammaproteobacteria bacterium]
MPEHLFSEDFREEPYWWLAAPRPRAETGALPARADTVVVGSGFTGLSAALTLARAGRDVVVLEADVPGYGASSRNAGFVGRTLKHSFASLLERRGETYAVGVYREMQAAFDFVVSLIEREQIRCHFKRCGRFMAAHGPAQYEAMARELELRRKLLGDESEMVPPGSQHREIGSDRYHGGAVIPDLGGLHPGLYHLGLLERAQGAGARVLGGTPVLDLARERDAGIAVTTARGRIAARDVIVATNGYTGPATPWLRRRVIPFPAYMIATAPLEEHRLARLFPNSRTVHDFNNNLVYMRRAPDSPRLLMGGLTGTRARDAKSMAPRLHRMLSAIFPELAGTRVARAWTGRCAGTFDLYPHLGSHDGVHYAVGYCFAGVPMGTWLGHKTALRVLGDAEAHSVFAERPFPTRAWYRGNPWFLPLVMAWYDHQDRRSAGARRRAA